MNVQLNAAFGGPLDVTLPEERLPVVLGRGEKADVAIDDRWVSRMHCELSVRNGQLFVRDLESKHGTYLNEHSVQIAPVRPGDLLEIGLTTIAIQTESSNSHFTYGS